MTLAHGEIIRMPQGGFSERLDRISIIAEHPDIYGVKPEVCSEAADLLLEGVDVSLDNVPDRHALPPVAQHIVDERVVELEQAPNGAELFIEPPAMSVWTKLRKRAHALQPLYTPDAERLGGPISSKAYDRPLFRMRTDGEGGLPGIRMLTAAQVVEREYEAKGRPEKGHEIISSHRDFADQPMDSVSRLFFQGTKDGAAIRTRAYKAIQQGVDHFAGEDGSIRKEGLRCASFACGAAGPVSLLIREMQDRGAKFDKAYFLDKDPMALAGAYETAEDAGVGDKVEVMLCDLIKDDFSETIAPNSLDVADLLGLIEYMPDQYAVELLRKVKGLMKPGGVVLWANMLKDRPQQKMFKRVVKWPPLKQRTIRESLGLAVEAGYDIGEISVSVPAKEGVYANFAMRVPERPSATPGLGALAVAA